MASFPSLVSCPIFGFLLNPWLLVLLWLLAHLYMSYLAVSSSLCRYLKRPWCICQDSFQDQVCLQDSFCPDPSRCSSFPSNSKAGFSDDFSVDVWPWPFVTSRKRSSWFATSPRTHWITSSRSSASTFSHNSLQWLNHYLVYDKSFYNSITLSVLPIQ